MTKLVLLLLALGLAPSAHALIYVCQAAKGAPDPGYVAAANTSQAIIQKKTSAAPIAIANLTCTANPITPPGVQAWALFCSDPQQPKTGYLFTVKTLGIPGYATAIVTERKDGTPHIVANLLCRIDR